MLSNSIHVMKKGTIFISNRPMIKLKCLAFNFNDDVLAEVNSIIKSNFEIKSLSKFETQSYGNKIMEVTFILKMDDFLTYDKQSSIVRLFDDAGYTTKEV